MLSVRKPGEAMDIIRKTFDRVMPCESVPITKASGRALAHDIVAQECVPFFDRSTVDGYAVVASDTFGCSDAMPAMLKLTDEVLIGQKPALTIKSGECIYVPTGGEIPPGADAMVMIEYAEDFGDGLRYISKSSAPGAHIVFKGDDVKPGKRVLEAGRILRPQDIGVLAALGYGAVEVRKRPRVGILSTGDELVGIDQTPKDAQVRDINSYTLYAGAQEAGGESVMLGICADAYDGLKNAVRMAIEDCDMLLISGGSSVGTRDATHRVIDELGNHGVLLHGIAIKPGKPTIVGEIGRKPVFGLPGHPVSAYFIFNLFVRPLIGAMLGAREGFKKTVEARLGTNLPSNHGREEYVSVRLTLVNGGLVAEPVYGKSGMITVLADADGYVRIERDCEGLMAGTPVSVWIM